MSEEEFARHVQPLVVRAARRIARGGRSNPEDLAQIGALAVLQLFRKMIGEIPSAALIVTAAKRAMFHEVRKASRQKRTGVELSLDERILKPGGRTESEAIRRLDVSRALKYLTAREREVIELTLIGHTLEEIGQGIDLSLNRVVQIRSGAVKKLRTLLAA